MKVRTIELKRTAMHLIAYKSHFVLDEKRRNSGWVYMRVHHETKKPMREE